MNLNRKIHMRIGSQVMLHSRWAAYCHCPKSPRNVAQELDWEISHTPIFSVLGRAVIPAQPPCRPCRLLKPFSPWKMYREQRSQPSAGGRYRSFNACSSNSRSTTCPPSELKTNPAPADRGERVLPVVAARQPEAARTRTPWLARDSSLCRGLVSWHRPWFAAAALP